MRDFEAANNPLMSYKIVHQFTMFRFTRFNSVLSKVLMSNK